MTAWNPSLRCPQCHATNLLAGASVRCSCGVIWELGDGVWRAGGADDSAYRADVDGLSDADLAEMTSIMRTLPPAEARRKIYTRFPVFGNYLFQEGRADWRFYTDTKIGDVVLDIGCGWGNLSLEFAREGRRVVAIDGSIGKLRFLAARCRSEGLSNVVCINHDFNLGLPCDDQSCRLVILNGVLEWAGKYQSRLSPMNAQRKLLGEVHRVLQCNGGLYIGIENRFGYHYFAGASDDHTEVRYTNLVPRFVADLMMLCVKQERYRTYTYSVHGMEKLLHFTGFGDVRFLYSRPDYKYFTELIPCETGPLEHFVRRQSHFEHHPFRWLAKMLLLNWFVAERRNRWIRLLWESYFCKKPSALKRFAPSLSVFATRKPA